MARYLITHSLLSSWVYAMKDNPFEDATSERDSYADFLASLNRMPIETTEPMQNGIDFENLVTSILNGQADVTSVWYDAALEVATRLRGAFLQYRAKCSLTVRGLSLVLYGRLDALKAGTVYDIKFSKSYEVGKYYDSTQHPVYMELIPEANDFSYIVSNGSSVWTETYRRDETPSIIPIIENFLDWLQTNGLLDVYKEKWTAL